MDCVVHGVTKSWTQLSDFNVTSRVLLLHFFLLLSFFSLFIWLHRVLARVPGIFDLHCSMRDLVP